MKKIINISLLLITAAGIFSSSMNYAIAPGGQRKRQTAEDKAHNRKAKSFNKQIQTETNKLADMKDSDVPQEQIEKQEEKIMNLKERAQQWLQDTYTSVSEMSTTAKALLATTAVAGAAVTADWYFGTGYVKGAAQWLYGKGRQALGYGEQPLRETPLGEMPGALAQRGKAALKAAAAATPAQIGEAAQRGGAALKEAAEKGYASWQEATVPVLESGMPSEEERVTEELRPTVTPYIESARQRIQPYAEQAGKRAKEWLQSGEAGE